MPELGLLGSVRKTSATVKGRPAMKGKHRLAAFTLAAKSLWQTALKASVSVSALFAASPAFAQGMDGARISMPFGGSVGAFEVIQFSIFLGAMGAALLSAGWLIATVPRSPMKTMSCVPNLQILISLRSATRRSST